MRNKLINSMAALVIAAGGMLLSSPSQAQVSQPEVPGGGAHCCSSASCSCCGASAAACGTSCSCS